MISKRLTKTQKAEILEAFRAGHDTRFLAEKYSCTTNTITRTVKTLLSDSEYQLLKERRSKMVDKKLKPIHSEALIGKKEHLSLNLNEEINNSEVNKIVNLSLEDADCFQEELSYKSKYNKNQELEKNLQNIDNNFELIEPLLSSFDFDEDKKKLDFEIINYESLPESVYMIVDKMVELDLQLISDLPEWNFLPTNELKRNAILLFSNQRSAKRSCSRNQRVIKIPNTSVFKISKSYLISKGITRLILEDSIFALDN